MSVGSCQNPKGVWYPVSLITQSYSVISCICDDTGIWYPQGITSITHGLQTQGYKIVSYHGIWILRSSLVYSLLLCSILCPYWYMKIFLNPVNDIEHPVLELEKEKGKGGFCR